MRPIWVLDSESDPFKEGREPQPFIWGIWDGKSMYKEFGSPAKVADFLFDKHVIVYAHNGGKFDYMSRVMYPNGTYDSLLNYLAPFSEVTIINGRLAKWNIGLCELRDSWNILPVPLAAYKKDTFDYRILERDQRNKPGNMRKIREYLKSDCMNLHELVTAFIDEFGMNLTQASAAMRTWHKMTGIKAPRSDHSFYDTHKKYYYGGRVECFKKGVIDAPFTVADITSAYPFAMMDYHPFSLELADLKGTDLRGAKLEGQSFYDVRCISRGALPYRVRPEDDDVDVDALRFPSDGVPRLYHVTGWELIAALDLELLKDWKIERCLRPLETLSFKEYIMRFWNERKEAKQKGDKAKDILCKLAMNSLYGKFAADPRNYGVFTAYENKYSEVLMADGHESESGEHFAGFLGQWALGEKELPIERQRFYNVTTSASITGYVRAYLLRSMAKCQGVLYCDTDSIAAFDTSALPLGGQLGNWAIEGKFDKAAIAGKKLYAYRCADKETIARNDGKPWKVRSKGVRLTWQDLVKVAEGGEVEFSPQVPTYSVHRDPTFTKRVVRMT